MTGRDASGYVCPRCHRVFWILERDLSGEWARFMPPNYCPYCGMHRWPCRMADEQTAEFADAPTLKPAREAPKTQVLQLGA